MEGYQERWRGRGGEVSRLRHNLDNSICFDKAHVCQIDSRLAGGAWNALCKLAAYTHYFFAASLHRHTEDIASG